MHCERIFWGNPSRSPVYIISGFCEIVFFACFSVKYVIKSVLLLYYCRAPELDNHDSKDLLSLVPKEFIGVVSELGRGVLAAGNQLNAPGIHFFHKQF